jgi:carbon starvation protein
VIFNNRLDAVVTAVLVAMVTLVLIESLRQWIGVLSGREDARLKESPFVATRLAEEQG